jgi:hypothetical protein
MSLPRIPFFAWVREVTRPAPWQVEPKVFSMATDVPQRRKEGVPMDPGMMTGWPMAWYSGGGFAD